MIFSTSPRLTAERRQAVRDRLAARSTMSAYKRTVYSYERELAADTADELATVAQAQIVEAAVYVSPNGTRFRPTVSNAGVLTTVAIPA